MSANSFTVHPGSNATAGLAASEPRRAPAGLGDSREENHGGLVRSNSKKAQTYAKTANLYREVTQAVNSKVTDFMSCVQQLDDEQDYEIRDLRQVVEELNRKLEDQIHHRVGVERRLEERCDGLDVEIVSLKSQNPTKSITRLQDRVDAFENSFGAATDHTTRQLEALQGSCRGLRRELDVAKETIQSYGTAAEAMEGSLRDVAGKAECICDLKKETEETHKKFVAQLEASLNGALAALHENIVASERGLRDEVQQRFDRVHKELEGSVCEALLVAKARLDQTNTRLDSCECQCAELTGRSSSFAENAIKMEENVKRVADQSHAEVEQACARFSAFERHLEDTRASHSAALEALRGDHCTLGENHNDAVEGLRIAIQNVQGHVKAHQDSFDSVEGLQKSVKDCQKHCNQLEEHCVNLMNSTVMLERHVQDSCKNTHEDLQAVKAHVNSILDAHQSGLRDLIAEEARAREYNHYAVQDRLGIQDRRHNDLEGIIQEFGHYKEHTNGALQNLAQNMANELKHSRDDIEQVHGLILTVQQAWGTKTKGLRSRKQQDNQRQPLSLLPAQFLKA